MSEQDYNNLKGQPLEQQAKFICEQNEKLDVPEWIDAGEIEGALDIDYAYIKQVALLTPPNNQMCCNGEQRSWHTFECWVPRPGFRTTSLSDTTWQQSCIGRSPRFCKKA